jgi:NAD-dependent SIR2 family protein deacetylase
MTDMNIIIASCTKCARTIENMENLVRKWGQLPLCKECGGTIDIVFGNTCRHHGESLSKGYCDQCASDELMDNQI